MNVTADTLPPKMLAMLLYNKRWKCYELTDVQPNIAFTHDCLTDIVDFLINHATT